MISVDEARALSIQAVSCLDLPATVAPHPRQHRWQQVERHHSCLVPPVLESVSAMPTRRAQ